MLELNIPARLNDMKLDTIKPQNIPRLFFCDWFSPLCKYSNVSVVQRRSYMQLHVSTSHQAIIKLI
jgi:hypothetical protein